MSEVPKSKAHQRRDAAMEMMQRNENKISARNALITSFQALAVIVLFASGIAWIVNREASTDEIRECVGKVDDLLKKNDQYIIYKDVKPSENNYDFLRGSYYSELIKTKDAMVAYLHNKTIPNMNDIHINFLKDCNLDYFKNNYESRIAELKDEDDRAHAKAFEDSTQKALADADKSNKEIDKALDSVIDDYKKQAVRHYTTNGAGHFKVEAFVLKSGKTVYCKTSITDAGKAVDCSE